MATTYSIAFWNLENLFDIEHSPRRSEKLERAIGRDLEGWDQALLDGKISQLARVIQQMNEQNGPDMLGVCEVENAHVLELLVAALAPLGRNYGIVHADTDDRRGIDVAFIYDSDLFRVEDHFNHFVMRRTATRDIFQVNFRTLQDRLFVAIGNHWPSRSGGKLESEGYRMIAGETLSYFHYRILQVHGGETPVLVMGDFNDEPFDASLVQYARSTRSRQKVINSTRIDSPRLFNLMWSLTGQRQASYYYNNFPHMIDQFLVNRNMLLRDAPIQIVPDSVRIFNNIPDMVDGGDYPNPIRFNGMGREPNRDGFSDHFPIVMQIEEQD